MSLAVRTAIRSRRELFCTIAREWDIKDEIMQIKSAPRLAPSLFAILVLSINRATRLSRDDVLGGARYDREMGMGRI